jgi:transcriptional regulator with XRE-family HTH domain
MAYTQTTSRKIISRRVRRVRKALMLTLQEMADQFGVRALEVWRWENKERVPRLQHQRTLYALEQTVETRKRNSR